MDASPQPDDVLDHVTLALWTASRAQTRECRIRPVEGSRRPDPYCALGGIRTPGRLIRSRMSLLQLSELR